MYQTLNLIAQTQPQKVQNIINNSQVVESDKIPPYFVLNENKSK